MIVTVNDRELQVEESMTIIALLANLGYPDRGIAVALNRAVLPRSQWDRAVHAGARVEVLTAVQGG